MKLKNNLERNESEIIKRFPEFNYQTGLEFVVGEVNRLLKNQKYVVVAFNSSGIDVGKTRLSRDIVWSFKNPTVKISAVSLPV
ncbi:MAG: hypothetical protein ABIF17_02450 [Patescibacteria group bacterium]